MKTYLRTLPLLLAGLFACAGSQAAPLGAGNVSIEAVKGADDVKIHAWETEDPMRSAVIAIEGQNAILAIESPAFRDDFPLWRDYLTKTGKPVEALLLSSHPGDGSGWYGKAKPMATAAAEKSIQSGPVAAMVKSLRQGFGETFDDVAVKNIETLEKDVPQEVAGFTVIAHDASDGTLFVFPKLKVAYIHMLSADYHSILPGKAAAQGYIADLEYLKKSGVERIYTSHHEPESADAIDTKLAYVRFVIQATEKAQTADEFKAAVKAEYPSYKRDQYLDMTAAGFFPAK